MKSWILPPYPRSLQQLGQNLKTIESSQVVVFPVPRRIADITRLFHVQSRSLASGGPWGLAISVKKSPVPQQATAVFSNSLVDPTENDFMIGALGFICFLKIICFGHVSLV